MKPFPEAFLKKFDFFFKYLKKEKKVSKTCKFSDNLEVFLFLHFKKN